MNIKSCHTQRGNMTPRASSTQTCSGLLVMSTPKALLKKEVSRGLRGGGLSRKEYILSSNAESEDSFSLICEMEKFSKNILLRRVEFGIWLKHHRKIWNFTRRSRVKFQIFLWCLKAKFQIPLSAEGCLLLTPRHLWNLTKICGVWAKFSQILKICENLAQTPQILVKFHRFWVVISGGEWCYQPNSRSGNVTSWGICQIMLISPLQVWPGARLM